MTPATVRLLDGVADSFNPLLAVFALAAPFLRRPRSMRAMAAYSLSAVAAIGVVYGIRALDARHSLWAQCGLDYSTHSAFAASLVASLAVFHRRWLGPLLGLLALYFGLQLIMQYHSVMDILTSASVAAGVAVLLGRAAVWMTRYTASRGGSRR